jgi:hypothetical protein
MKTKKLGKKFQLNKIIIVNLDHQQMGQVRGGSVADSVGGSIIGCVPVSRTCPR